MSKENVKKFYDALAQDSALAEELNERIAKATREFAAEKGFIFTVEDQCELSDEDLDNVNGGKIRFKSKTWWDKIKGKDENKKG